MEITFKKKKFAREANDYDLLKQRHGSQRANLIRRRLDELNAANNLDEIRTLPHAQCHELKANRAGQLSVDLDHPYRLLFRPSNYPVPKKSDGGLD
jgi:plasmid maintenance system killer protein